MSIKIVCDSAADIFALKNTAFQSVPMHIITAEKEFHDVPTADPDEMIEFLENYKGKSSSACPNVTDWLEAFGDSDEIICITITSGLSGSYSSACIARDTYLTEHPNRKVFVLDTLSAGPEMGLIVKYAEKLIVNGYSFDEVKAALTKYLNKTSLLFILGSLNNFAKNGRVNPAVAKITGILGIRLIGRASAKGTLEPLCKAKGDKKSIERLFKAMIEGNYNGGYVRIDHCKNQKSAEALKMMIHDAYPEASVTINETKILCSFYAERGGMLVAFEKEFEKNNI